MADVTATMSHLDKIYNNVSDAIVTQKPAYNPIKQESAGIKQLLKANSDDAKLKPLIAKIEGKFTTLHKVVGEFSKAKEAKSSDVVNSLKSAYSEWRTVLKSPGLK